MDSGLQGADYKENTGAAVGSSATLFTGPTAPTNTYFPQAQTSALCLTSPVSPSCWLSVLSVFYRSLPSISTHCLTSPVFSCCWLSVLSVFYCSLPSISTHYLTSPVFSSCWLSVLSVLCCSLPGISTHCLTSAVFSSFDILFCLFSTVVYLVSAHTVSPVPFSPPLTSCFVCSLP